MAGPDNPDPRCSCPPPPQAHNPQCRVHGNLLYRDPSPIGPRFTTQPPAFDINEFMRRFGAPPTSERLTWAPEDDGPPDRLTPEEDIRTWALDAASRVFAGRGAGSGRAVIQLAREFERYLLGENDAESPAES